MAYEELDLVVAHLGGGVSVSAHRHGRVVDTNQALDGFGPFSPERAGTLDAGQLVRMAFSGEYTQEQMLKMLAGRGGLMAHLGTNDARAAYERALAGDQHARLVLEAMAYGAAKEIGAMHVVLEGRTDAILLTGGIAYNEALVGYIRRMVGGLAPVRVYPGEDEMEALAMSGLRVLRGEPAKVY